MIALPKETTNEQLGRSPSAEFENLDTQNATGISAWISGDLRKIARQRLEQLIRDEEHGMQGLPQALEDLVRHQIELEFRGTKLEKEKKIYFDYFESVPLPSVRINATGEIVEANSSAKEFLFRLPGESLSLSERFAQQMSEPGIQTWNEFLKELRNQGESASADIHLNAAGEPPLSFRLLGKQLHGGDCWVYFCPRSISLLDASKEFPDKNSEEKHLLTDLALRFLQAEAKSSDPDRSESAAGNIEDITSLCDQAGMLMKIQSLSTEITERKLAEAEFTEIAAKAREASDAKTAFIANMSHEIRTPMSGIIGITEMLLESGLDANQTHYMRMLHASARSLLALMNDILDISKIEAGKIELELLVFDLRKMLKEFGEEWKIVAHGKGIDLDVITAPNIPHWVCGDPHRLRQILVNLTSNALKFTETGGVKISVVLEHLHEGEACLQFEISDSGEGIPKEKISMLFERFMQADTSVSRKHGGTGLGLTICKELVTLMHGDIGVESRNGNGSTFRFTVRMPVCEDPQAGNADVLRDEDSEALAGNVLLVEDFVPNQVVIREMISRMGLQCDCAVTGHEALEKLASRPYDIVLMDLQIPGIDGINTTVRLRAGKSASLNHTIPVIALTGHASKESKALCLRAGMNDHLTKPVEKKHLIAMLRRWLATTSVAQPVEKICVTSTKAAPAFEKNKIYDNAVLLKSLDGDIESWHAFAKSCLIGMAEEKLRLQGIDCGDINLETAVGRLRAAQEAEVQADCGISSCTSSVLRAGDASRIKPASCADRPDPTAVSRIKAVAISAHSIKGTAGYLAATALKDSAGRLEMAARAEDWEKSVDLLPEVILQIDVLLEAIRSDLLRQGVDLD